MAEPVGIGPEDLAVIERDEFVHYLTLARELHDPSVWPEFREQLLRALAAAFAFDVIWIDKPLEQELDKIARRRQRALELIDAVRAHHDPVTDWHAFFDALWERRGLVEIE